MTLVNAHKESGDTSKDKDATLEEKFEQNEDPDITRAHRLLLLHEKVKLAYVAAPSGQGSLRARQDLDDARKYVRDTIQSLKLHTNSVRPLKPEGASVQSSTQPGIRQEATQPAEAEEEDFEAWD